jgi:hypothetical protein
MTAPQIRNASTMSPVFRLVTSACCLGALMALVPGAQAQELSYSGFGTIGYAQSNQEAHYQRFIDDKGTFKRDSILGGQVDARFTPEWSATVQATLAPSLGNDNKLAVKASWAFVSWRPTNDWLVRVGKQRVPLFLNTENRDVGQTYDQLRLPSEVYSISPSTDLTGLSVSRTWLGDAGEWTFDAYSGSGMLDVRTSSRDMGPQYLHVKAQATGAALSLKLDTGSIVRASVYHAVTRQRNGDPFPNRFPQVDIPGVGSYYAVDPRDPTVGKTNSIVNDVITVGADIAVAPNWRVVTEVARNVQQRTDVGSNTVGAYVAVLHQMDRFTPYVSLARLRSLGASMRVADALDQVNFPSPGDQVNFSQRITSDSIYNYDQTSLTLGVSYALTTQTKLKGEWMRTRVGKRSAMVDSLQGQAAFNHENIDVFSLAYNFAF